MTPEQIKWLKAVEIKDLVRARVKKGWSKEYFEEILGEWNKIHRYNIDYWSQPDNWKTNEKDRPVQMQIGTHYEQQM